MAEHAFQDAMRNALASGKASSSDSGNETTMDVADAPALEDPMNIGDRIKKLEGMIDMIMKSPRIGELIEQTAEATNVGSIRETSNMNRGPLRTTPPSDDRKSMAVALLRRVR